MHSSIPAIHDAYGTLNDCAIALFSRAVFNEPARGDSCAAKWKMRGLFRSLPRLLLSCVGVRTHRSDSFPGDSLRARIARLLALSLSANKLYELGNDCFAVI